MKKKLVIAICSIFAVAAIVTGSVLGTIAYLTASAAVSNVFTVGNVQIVMDESKVKPDGTLDTTYNGRVDTNTYHLVPGKQYRKDPQIRVNEGSEDSYLFVLVRNDLEGIGPKGATPYLTIAEQMEYLGWRPYVRAATGMVYIYCGASAGNNNKSVPTSGAEFDAIIAARATTATDETWTASLTVQNGVYNLFEYFYTDPSNKDLSTYGAAKITLTAVAIQATGFEGEVGSKEAVDLAWAAVKDAYPYIHTGSNN